MITAPFRECKTTIVAYFNRRQTGARYSITDSSTHLQSSPMIVILSDLSSDIENGARFLFPKKKEGSTMNHSAWYYFTWL